MKRTTMLVAAGIGIALVIVAVVVVLVVLPGGTIPGGDTTANAESPELAVGEPATFTFGGEEHTAKLIECVGESAIIVIGSSPTPYTLAQGQPVTAGGDLRTEDTHDAGPHRSRRSLQGAAALPPAVGAQG